MEKELVSIIVPAYNAQRYIKKCLDSLIAQTYEKIEILVINDGSTDDTGHICDDYSKDDARIRVFHIQNGGVSKARNYGLRAAAGSYIMFVDSDDYVADNYVETHYTELVEQKVDWVITGYYICYPDRQEKNNIQKKYCEKIHKENLGKVFSKLYQGYFLNSPWNKIYKKAYITKEFCTDMALGEDLCFNLDYLENVSFISIKAACCYYYICDDQKDSLTKRISRGNFQSEMKNYHRLMEWSERLAVKDLQVMQRMYVESTISMLFTMARKAFTAEEKQEIIRDLCQDMQTCKAMTEIKTENWKSELLRKLLAKGSQRKIFWLLKAVQFF